MGDEGLQELEALGLLCLLPRHSVPGYHLPLPIAETAALLYRQCDHPVHPLLFPDWSGLLPAHRLRYELASNTNLGGWTSTQNRHWFSEDD